MSDHPALFNKRLYCQSYNPLIWTIQLIIRRLLNFLIPLTAWFCLTNEMKGLSFIVTRPYISQHHATIIFYCWACARHSKAWLLSVSNSKACCHSFMKIINQCFIPSHVCFRFWSDAMLCCRRYQTAYVTAALSVSMRACTTWQRVWPITLLRPWGPGDRKHWPLNWTMPVEDCWVWKEDLRAPGSVRFLKACLMRATTRMTTEVSNKKIVRKWLWLSSLCCQITSLTRCWKVNP